MSYASDIAKLTSDPGARALARALDIVVAQVDQCCGGAGVKGTAAAPPVAESPSKEESAPK